MNCTQTSEMKAGTPVTVTMEINGYWAGTFRATFCNFTKTGRVTCLADGKKKTYSPHNVRFLNT